MAIESFGENERAIEQDIDRQGGGYGGDYFDENEHRAGQEKRDLATGKEFKNDGSLQTSHGMVVDTEGSLIHIEEEMKDEAATKWLLENGFDVEGNAIFPEKKNPA
jgi:hypothetical protein